MSAEPAKTVGITPAAGHQHSFDFNAAARRLANITQYGSQTATAAYGAQLAPVADPNMKLSGYHHGFQDTMRICIGTIVDTIAITNSYRVQLEKLHSTIVATPLLDTGQSIFGATTLNTFSPGAGVLVAVHPKLAYGLILGCLPETNETGWDALHDYITQATRKRVDDAHKKYIKLIASTDMPDFSNWKPWDATAGNEWGAVSSTGLKVTLDDFMVQAAVNEFCGVFGFYHDMMLRLAGYNMQIWTAGHERDAYMDQAEYNDYQGYTPYPWEQMGVFDPKEIIQEYWPPNYQCPNEQPFYAHWENKKECQQPFHRTHNFYGYLGQGARRIVQAPPIAKPPFWSYKPGPTNGPDGVYESPIETQYSLGRDCASGPPKTEDYREKPPIQTHEDNVALDGRRFIASSKSVLIAKRLALPSIMRRKRPEAGDGDDTEKNYKAASKHGNGPEHPITGDIKTTGRPNLQRATAVLDLHAYFYNYSGLHVFHWHDKDYKTFEQSELEPKRFNQKVPPFGILVGETFLPQPTPIILPIDHRYDKEPQKFYETESFLSLLEDGSVVLGDGYGAEIRMTAGSLFLSAPGDVWMKPGRNAQIWAGRDIIQRAVKNVDISSTERSVRVKAERNVLIFAGNETSDREGGVLIESRANYSVYDFERCGEDILFGGVVLRAPHSEVVGMARRIYLRTAGSDVFTGGDDPGPAGPITLDAGRGTAEIVTKSKNIYHYVGDEGAIFQFFRNQADDDTVLSNYFSKQFTLLNGPLGVDGTVLVDGIDNGASFVARGHIISSEGHIITEEAARGNLFVWPCDAKCQRQVNKAVEQTRKYIEDILPKIGERIDDEQLKQLWYAEKRPGHNRVMDIMEFTFRTTKQYKTETFEMWEDRWQQLGRFCGNSEKWKERPVPSKVCEESWPFPGKEKFTQPIFMTQDLERVEQGCDILDKDRLSDKGGVLAGIYEKPKFLPPQKKPLTDYPIIGGGY